MKEPLPVISIVTPSFNQGEFIEETIVSVLSQEYPALEFIIMDGGSTDNTVEIIKKYADRISFWVSEPDRGQTDAINKGFRMAKGEILTWINSDDVVAPGTLHEVARLFREKNALAVCGPVTIFDSKKSWTYPAAYANGESLLAVIGRDSFNQPGTYFHRDAVEAIGLPDERLRYVMDKEWFVRFLLRFGTDRIVVTDHIMAKHRYHDQSKTVAETGRFMTEYATVIHRMARSLQLKEVMELLEEKYDTRDHIYSFGPDPALQPVMVKQMAFVLLVNRFFRVYKEEDFRFGKKLLALLPSGGPGNDQRTAGHAEQLRSAVAYPGWFFFRLARKFLRSR